MVVCDICVGDYVGIRAPHASHYSQTAISDTGVATLAMVATSFCSVNEVLDVKHSADANVYRSGVIYVRVKGNQALLHYHRSHYTNLLYNP